MSLDEDEVSRISDGQGSGDLGALSEFLSRHERRLREAVVGLVGVLIPYSDVVLHVVDGSRQDPVQRVIPIPGRDVEDLFDLIWTGPVSHDYEPIV